MTQNECVREKDKIRLLWSMSGHTRQDKVMNECVREKVEVAPVEEKYGRI